MCVSEAVVVLGGPRHTVIKGNMRKTLSLTSPELCTPFPGGKEGVREKEGEPLRSWGGTARHYFIYVSQYQEEGCNIPTSQRKKLRLRWVERPAHRGGRDGAGICTHLCLALSLCCVFLKAKALAQR